MAEPEKKPDPKYRKIQVNVCMFTKLVPGEWEDEGDPRLSALITEYVFKALKEWTEQPVKRITATVDFSLAQNEYY